jgi:hypothetical protein
VETLESKKTRKIWKTRKQEKHMGGIFMDPMLGANLFWRDSM